MPIISTKEHEKLIGYLCNGPVSNEENDWEGLQEDVRSLQQLYNNYQSKLSALRKLAIEYETLHKRIRVELRKQQIRAK